MKLNYLYFDLFTLRSFLHAMRYALVLGISVIVLFCYFQYLKKKEIHHLDVSLQIEFPTYQKNEQFYHMLSTINLGTNIDNKTLYDNFLDLFVKHSNIDSFLSENDIFQKALQNTQISNVKLTCLAKKAVSWIEVHTLFCSFTLTELEKGFVQKLPIQKLFIMYVQYINRKNIEEFKQSVSNFLELKKNVIKKQLQQLSKYRKDKQFRWLDESLEKKSVELLSTYFPEQKKVDFTSFSVIDSDGSNDSSGLTAYNSVHRSWLSSMLYVFLLILGFYFLLLYILYSLYSKK